MKTTEEKAAFVAQLAATIYAAYIVGEIDEPSFEGAVGDAIGICKAAAREFDISFEVA